MSVRIENIENDVTRWWDGMCNEKPTSKDVGKSKSLTKCF